MPIIKTRGEDPNRRLWISEHETKEAISYRKHPANGQSDLKMFSRKRRLYYEKKILGFFSDNSESPQQELGKLLEGMLLQPYMYQVAPRDVLTKSGSRAGNKYKEWVQSLGEGVMPITEDQLAVKDAVYAAVERHPRVHRLLYDHKINVHPRVIDWECPYSGLSRKAEMDLWLPEKNVLIDIKTTVDPSPGAFDVECWKWGYHIQAATYREAMQVADYDVDAYIIIAIRNLPPYDVEDHLITKYDMDDGDEWNERWMTRLAKAIETNDWGPRTEEKINVIRKPLGFHGGTWDDERLGV